MVFSVPSTRDTSNKVLFEGRDSGFLTQNNKMGARFGIENMCGM